MSYKTWRAQQLLGAFFVWLSQPRTLVVGGVCIGIGVFTWQYFDEPIFGFTIRTFVTQTLPLWVNSFIAYTARVAAQRPVFRILHKVLTIFALQAIVEWARMYFEKELAWWQSLHWFYKLCFFISFVAVFWVLIGWWAFMLFPVYAARDVVVYSVRALIHYWGLRPLLESAEMRFSQLTPESVRGLYNRIDRAVHAWAYHHREKLHNHHRVIALSKRARKKLYTKKQREEAQKRTMYTEYFRAKFKRPPLF